MNLLVAYYFFFVPALVHTRAFKTHFGGKNDFTVLFTPFLKRISNMAVQVVF